VAQYNSSEYNTQGYSTTNNNPSTTPLQDSTYYNGFQYNEESYNGTPGVAWLQLSDSMPMIDSVAKSISKPLSESVSFLDTVSKSGTKVFTSFLSMEDQIIKEVLEKKVVEDVDIDIWLTIDKNDDNSSFREP